MKDLSMFEDTIKKDWYSGMPIAEILRKVYYKDCIGLQRKIDLAETTKI